MRNKYILFTKNLIKKYFYFFINHNDFINKNYKFKNNHNSNLSIISKFKFDKGWYLTRFRFENDTKNLIGTFRTSRSSFKQKRLYKYGKFVYRLIRISKKDFVQFSINSPVNNFQLEFYRLPFLIAILIILKNNKRIGIFEISKFNIPKNWFYYNNSFNYKSKRKNIITYNNLIKVMELKHIKLYTKKTKLENFSFCILDYSEFNIVEKEWVIPLKKGDQLSHFALEAFQRTIKDHANCNLIYSDEDFIDENNLRSYPKFKTAWNRELFWSDPDFGRCWVIKGYLWNKALKYYQNKKINSIPNILEIIYFITQYLEENNKKNTIYHLPIICYHRKKNNDDIENRKGDESTIKNLYDHIFENQEKIGKIRKVSLIPSINCHRIHWCCPKNSRISIIIPTKNKKELLEKCVNSIKKYSLTKNHEIIIVDNNSTDRESKKYLNLLNSSKSTFDIKIKSHKGAFNYSLINNNASKKANGDILLFLNNDVEFITQGWDRELISNASRKDIGCVGIKLIYPDYSIQHAGVILGLSNFAGYSHKLSNKDMNGYECRIQIPQEYNALTGACLALEKTKWNKLKGMNSEKLVINYNDIDLCLRSHQLGFKNIYLPFVEAIHKESSTRGKLKDLHLKQWKKEVKWMRSKWKKILLQGDLFYNPNLTLLYEDFSLGINQGIKEKFNPRNLS